MIKLADLKHELAMERLVLRRIARYGSTCNEEYAHQKRVVRLLQELVTTLEAHHHK